jgi:cytochrome c556
MAPLLNAARLLDAAAQSQPLGSSSSSAAADEAVHRRRQQAVMKSLKPFVALTGSMGQGQPGYAAEQQQLAMALVQQCQEQLDRYDTQPACGVMPSSRHWDCCDMTMQSSALHTTSYCPRLEC